MKWPDNIAQAFRPGYVRSSTRPREALRPRPRLLACGVMEYWSATLSPNSGPGFPGLKARAVLLRRFMANGSSLRF
jgi:hypothetical protein